ncbi:MAG: hypothetical protein IH855_01090 [Bacteroidetes bacterium]|nr:hypothetical protein [Bacteroidota bacterium]
MTKLVPPPPTALTDARLQLHHAAQIAASFGYTFVPPRPDWSHTSLTWNRNHQALISAETDGVRVGLRLADCTLVVFDGAESKHACPLSGKTLEDGYAWLEETLTAMDSETMGKPLVRPDHELPTHPVGTDASFSLEEKAAFEAVSAWFDFADGRLRLLGEEYPHMTPVACWPHHFDIARVILLSPDADQSKDPSVGVGLSPGDHAYAEPYWYVTHWPSPEGAELPPLPSGGHWHTEEWTGAVLPGSAFAHLDAASLTDAFLASAIASSLALIQEP